LKSSGWTVAGSSGSLKSTRTLIVSMARANDVRGESTSDGTATVANSELPPPPVIEAAKTLPGAGSLGKL
jgi:hypothetical protein